MEQLSMSTQRVDLSDEEKMERGLKLANLLREADLMEAEHDEQKKAMREERQALEQQIAALADVVRTGKEERPIDDRPEPEPGPPPEPEPEPEPEHEPEPA